MSDKKVERVAELIWNDEPRQDVTWAKYTSMYTDITNYYHEPHVRHIENIRSLASSIVASLDEEPTLEDVFGTDQRFAVMYVGIVQQGDDHWVALVDDARTRKRVEGVGSTIDAAIRAAVANAKEQGGDDECQ